jgi:hypothetical protein
MHPKQRLGCGEHAVACSPNEDFGRLNNLSVLCVQSALNQFDVQFKKGLGDASGATTSAISEISKLREQLEKLKAAENASKQAQLDAENKIYAQQVSADLAAKEQAEKAATLQQELKILQDQYNAKVAAETWKGMPVTADTTSVIIDELAYKTASEVKIDADYIPDTDRREWFDKCPSCTTSTYENNST